MNDAQVRRIRRGHRGNRGRIVAPKAGGRAEFESTLERDYYFLLGMDDEVVSFQPQPVRLPYVAAGGRRKTYVPDVLVTYHTRPSCIFEIKHVAELVKDPAEFRTRFQAARAFCRTQGWQFSTVTEKSIRGPRLTNVTFLRPFLDAGRTFPEEDQHFLLERLGVSSTAEDLLAGLPLLRKGEVLPTLWHLVAAGRIAFAVGEPLSVRSRLWRPA